VRGGGGKWQDERGTWQSLSNRVQRRPAKHRAGRYKTIARIRRDGGTL